MKLLERHKFDDMPSGACPGARTRAPRLVLGLGNILLRDEGVGVRVVEALDRLPLPPDVELCDGGTAGFALLDVLAERREVIVIDAVDAGRPAGTIVRLTADDLAMRPGQRVSLHEIGLAETLLAARRLGIAPAKVLIFGVQPAVLECGLDLSPEVAGRLPELIALIRVELMAGAARPA